MTDTTEYTEIAQELLDLPFHRKTGVEIERASPDDGRTRIPYDESLVGNPEVEAIHGGVLAALADLTGAVPFVATREAYTPTVDLRVDYLSHASTADLIGEATVLRRGSTLGVADVTIRADGVDCVSARGVYKLTERPLDRPDRDDR